MITGGSRSGKSAFAQQMAESLPGPRLFVATCPVIDEEMQERIRLHQEARDPGKWQTREEILQLEKTLEENQTSTTVLIDCLTLWINNLMYDAVKMKQTINEHIVADRVGMLINMSRQRSGTVIFVTNEVGLGIVPENTSARLYRDLTGRCNQCMGRSADKVFLVSCGIPLQLK